MLGATVPSAVASTGTSDESQARFEGVVLGVFDRYAVGDVDDRPVASFVRPLELDR
jgi:hypothetical protein